MGAWPLKISVYRKDDDWKLSRGVYIFVIIGLLLLLGAISAVIVVIKPWTVSAIHFSVFSSVFYLYTWASRPLYIVHAFPLLIVFGCHHFPILQIGAAFLLVLLLMVLAIGSIHRWASNNFYLSRTQMFFVCFLAFLLALAAFLVGWFEGEANFIICPDISHSIDTMNWLLYLCPCSHFLFLFR